MTVRRSALLIMLLIFLPPTALASKRYVVKKGDNLSNLSKRFRISLQSIKRANRLNTDRLNIGDTLLIPDSEDKRKGVNVSKKTEEKKDKDIESKSDAQIFSLKYLVKNEDTLSEIANRFGLTIKELKSANGLSDDSLKSGMILTIPDSRNLDVASIIPLDSQDTKTQGIPSYKHCEYLVKNGDTLTTIADSFTVSISDLKNANELSSDEVRAGMRLMIPTPSFPTTVKPVTAETGRSSKYVVKKGDSVNSVARKYSITQSDLKKANGIKGNKIIVGQILNIPTGSNIKSDLSIEDIRVTNDNLEIKRLPEVETRKVVNNRKLDMNENGVSREVIISIAKRFLGAPYRFGGTSLLKGLDCSAFVNKVFSFFNVDLPRTAREIYKMGRSISKGELSAGDLVFFRTYASYPSHVGIYIGESEFIHASSAAKKVRINSINESYYSRRYLGAKRIVSAGLFYKELSKDYKGFEQQ